MQQSCINLCKDANRYGVVQLCDHLGRETLVLDSINLCDIYMALSHCTTASNLVLTRHLSDMSREVIGISNSYLSLLAFLCFLPVISTPIRLNHRTLLYEKYK